MQRNSIQEELFNAISDENKQNAVPAICERIIKKPESPVDYFKRGRVYTQQKEYHLALSDFNKCIALDQQEPIFYYERALVYQILNKSDEALADYNKLIVLTSNLSFVYAMRGNFFLTQNKYDEALIDFDKAIKLNSNFLSIYFSRGKIYKIRKRYEEAIANFTTYLQLNAEEAWVYYQRGEVYKEQGKLIEAVSDGIRAFKIDRELWPFISNLIDNINIKDLFNIIKNLPNKDPNKFLLLGEILSASSPFGKCFRQEGFYNKLPINNSVIEEMKNLYNKLLAARNKLIEIVIVFSQGNRQKHTLFGLSEIAKKIAVMSAEDMPFEVAEKIIEEKNHIFSQQK